jgi:glucose/arabinose dehydrogenase
VLDEGAVWAPIAGVRATNIDEGLLGIALAPDFATSGLVYVYLTTTDDENDQQIRVYRETATGTGEYLGTVATALEPPVGSSNRNGGGLAFGVDGCLYVGVGDNGSQNRWNAQVLAGTDPIQFNETTNFCDAVCLGPDEYPDRADDNGLPNHSGKVLRLHVEGASPAQAGDGAVFAANPAAFGTGFGNPVALGVHPLTGQLLAAERGENNEAEIDVVDARGNYGWPCLQGTEAGTTGATSCLVGLTATDVYGNHPDWRRPIATHPANPAIGKPAAYTGRAYPAAYYGDVFYLLRESARIYRLDLAPPCFLPHPAGMAPLPFHDSDTDGDFRAFYDVDGDGESDNPSFFNLTGIAQAPSPIGAEVLYVVGRQNNSSALDQDSIIFRLEYATSFTPYQGPDVRVPDSCYTQGPFSGGQGGAPYAYENPFERQTCLPAGGACPGAPDGTACDDDGDPCNGSETCQGDICRHGAWASDGTGCSVSGSCREAGVCQEGRCTLGAVVADGTPCFDGEPCNGLETCAAGVCQPANGPASLAVTKLVVKNGTSPGTDGIVLTGVVAPVLPIDPSGSDDVSVELEQNDAALYSGTLDHPRSDPLWDRSRPPQRFVYRDRTGFFDGLTAVDLVRQRSGGFTVKVKGKRLSLPDLAGPQESPVRPRIVVGDLCFEASLGVQCRLTPRKLTCKP